MLRRGRHELGVDPVRKACKGARQIARKQPEGTCCTVRLDQIQARRRACRVLDGGALGIRVEGVDPDLDAVPAQLAVVRLQEVDQGPDARRGSLGVRHQAHDSFVSPDVVSGNAQLSNAASPYGAILDAICSRGLPRSSSPGGATSSSGRRG